MFLDIFLCASPIVLYIYFVYFIHKHDQYMLFITKLTHALYSHYEYTDNDINNEIETETDIKIDKKIEKYEDKYLDYIRKMKKESEPDNDRELQNISKRFVMETTPNGNVIMLYKKDIQKFIYYSDNAIPYRYLEVVARKYVKMFQCRSFYIDMDEELCLYEEKMKKKEEEEKNKKEEVPNKKSVFAQFKSYNKDTVIKPSNSNSNSNKHNINMNAYTNNNINTSTSTNTKIHLKEQSNNYIHEGKMCNFSLIQKPDKTIFNKKLALSFAEFKKINMNI